MNSNKHFKGQVEMQIVKPLHKKIVPIFISIIHLSQTTT